MPFCLIVAKASRNVEVTAAIEALVCPRTFAGEGKIISICTWFNSARFWLTDLISDIVRYRIGNSGLLVWKTHFNLTRRIG